MRRTTNLVMLAILLSAQPIATLRAGDDSIHDDPGMPADSLDFRLIIGRAKQKVFPAVVFIKCIQQTHAGGQKSSQQVSGSGVIISPTGEALTNWHVIDKALKVRCLLSDGRAFSARVVGSDKDVDVALLQLDVGAGEPPLPFAGLGDSDKLVEGDFVMAMGAPWGLNRSVSIGIVSCADRFLPDSSEYNLWLQTDAAISPGNSGGPLVNTDGQVVGINSIGMLWGGDIGFALPSNIVRQLLPRLRDKGKIDWSWTGIKLQPLRDFDRDIYFDASNGVIVASTDPSSPAEAAGLLSGDRIIGLNGTSISAHSPEEVPALRRMIGLLPKNEPAQLDVVRAGEKINLALVPREKGSVEGVEMDCPRWDMAVKSINQFDNPGLYFYRKQGVFIFGVEHIGNAAKSGLRSQDIILKISDDEIVTVDDLRAAYERAVENVHTRPRALFTVLRGGAMKQVVLEFAREYEKE